MKVNVTKKALAGALGILERIIPSRSSNPLLTALKIEGSERGLHLQGTNLEIDVRVFVPAEVNDPQNVAVPAHLFGQIVRSLGGDLVELTTKEAELAVKSGGSKFNVQTADVEAYPPLNFPPLSECESIGSADAFVLAAQNVRYAVSNENFQAVFRGVKLERGTDKLKMVSSDGYRVAIQEFDAPGAVQANPVIIPGRSLDEVMRAIAGAEGLHVKFRDDGILSLITENVEMNVRLLDGDFPDYNRVIPKEIKMTVTLPAATLQESVSRVAVLADKNANNRIGFLIQDGRLTVDAEGDYGKAQDVLDVMVGGTEQAMSLAFNAKHVLDALKPVSGDVELLFSGSTTPAIFQPHGATGYLGVMVTLRA